MEFTVQKQLHRASFQLFKLILANLLKTNKSKSLGSKYSNIYLYTLFSQISASPVVKFHHHQPVTQGFDGSIDSHNPAGAFSGHVQVVGDGPGCHFQHIIWSALIQEDLTQSWEKCPWRTPTVVRQQCQSEMNGY